MQGQIGCCVGCTFEELCRLIVLMTGGTQTEPLSFRWVYAICKALDGIPTQEGTYPSIAAQVIRNFGVPLAKYFPNDVTLTHAQFTLNGTLKDKAAIIKALGQEAYDDAQTRKAGADLTTPISESGIKQAINYAKANKGGVAILRQVGEEYWTAGGVSTWDKNKLMPMPHPAVVESGHEETLYGYLDITKQERADLTAHKITLESLLAKYPDGTVSNPVTNTETLILWLNHWSAQWASTGGNSTDGGYGWEFLDIWLPYIKELRVSVAALPPAPNNFRYDFTKQMKDGDKGADIVALQHVLDIEGCYDYTGTPKYTGNYGTYTHNGVKQLQEKYASEILAPLNLTKGTGVVAASTLKWLQKHYAVTK